jgi:geranylgeranyl pyrophosphate synthase
LAEISQTHLIAPALRLVHRRIGEVIFGQAAENGPEAEDESTIAYYERLAQGKSASLLSLSLELPLLLAGHPEQLATAHAAACAFAVAYQIADDLTDLVQDKQEGSLNLVLLFMQRLHQTQVEAIQAAADLAQARLASSARHAGQLPHHCAAAMLKHADKLARSIAEFKSPERSHPALSR